ncbi:hypothetical protein [Enterocloster clostridioformis]|uniref:Uncharacterized protein n=1 Tax=Enterocloster clostridioformis TaxID=1531 RepID=A0A829W5E0_9FIRM|nr:hypothetical protein [Enterocloster clostridioformis]ENZ28661.1 hypothetical protein HMPREF1087_01154 [[Clostridium] clostridioforme 90A1]ENZ74496.1 hypothetical protein HMPREF1081_00018 [[Clostridium] clostridioforme 90A4]GEA37525.1 hypothetical protein Ccl03g_32380 [Enterocloster clostridioformis]
MDITVKDAIKELLNYPMDEKIKIETKKGRIVFEAFGIEGIFEATGKYPDKYLIIRLN